MSQAQPTVTIFSAPWCAFCKTEKQYLDHLGVSYAVRDIEEDAGAMQELLEKSGQQSVPVTFIGDTLVRGFDRLKIDAALRASGLLTAV